MKNTISVDDILKEENHEYQNQVQRENSIYQDELEKTIRGFYVSQRFLIEEFPKVNAQFQFWLKQFDELGHIPASDILDNLRSCFNDLIELKNQMDLWDLKVLENNTSLFYSKLKLKTKEDMLYNQSSFYLTQVLGISQLNLDEKNSSDMKILLAKREANLLEELRIKEIEDEKGRRIRLENERRNREEMERLTIRNQIKARLGIKGIISHSKIEFGSGEDTYLKTFFYSLHGDWSRCLGIENTAHFNKSVLHNLLLKRNLNIIDLLQINSNYIFDNSNDDYAIVANDKTNLPINFFSSLEELSLNNSNIEFLSYAKLPKLKKLTLISCFYGYHLIGSKMTGKLQKISIKDDIINFFKLNHLDCQINIIN